jgi:hypothetical protein
MSRAWLALRREDASRLLPNVVHRSVARATHSRP